MEEQDPGYGPATEEGDSIEGGISMAQQLLQVNFKFSVTRAEFEQLAAQLASSFAELDGLRWKVWLMNERQNEAGGIYLFEDEASLQSYLDGPLAAQVMSHPALSELSAKPFELLAEPTATTRGPV
jgi:hypothetical protein